jgi:hypothetical protein
MSKREELDESEKLCCIAWSYTDDEKEQGLKCDCPDCSLLTVILKVKEDNNMAT